MPEIKLPYPMKRHEAARWHYRQSRYARHLTQPELNCRIRDVLLNLLVLTREAKIGLLPIDGDGPRWMELFTHLLEEMQIRHGPYPAGFTREAVQTESEPFPDFVGELGKKAAKAFGAKGLTPGEALIKYGKSKYMSELFERGAMRVQPASFYSRPEHNGAVRDDELTLPLSLVLTRDDIVKLVTNPHDVPAEAKEQRLDLSLKFRTDYWLYCLSESIEPRMFVDFAADSCVIIRDKPAFISRVMERVRAKIAAVEAASGRATYIDPLLPATGNINIPFAKHFRYTYQREFRLAWVPRDHVARLAHFDVEIGPLADIAEYVAL